MDFNAAILAHKTWRERLRASVAHGEKIDAAIASRDDHCELGKWIQSASAQERSLPEYGTLKEKHAHFHRVVGDTLVKMSGKKPAEADAMLDPNSAFGAASAECVLAIGELKRKLAA